MLFDAFMDEVLFSVMKPISEISSKGIESF